MWLQAGHLTCASVSSSGKQVPYLPVRIEDWVREFCMTYNKCSTNGSYHWIVIFIIVLPRESCGKEKLKSFFSRWHCYWQYLTLREGSDMHVKNLKIRIAGEHQRDSRTSTFPMLGAVTGSVEWWEPLGGLERPWEGEFAAGVWKQSHFCPLHKLMMRTTWDGCKSSFKKRQNLVEKRKEFLVRHFVAAFCGSYSFTKWMSSSLL